jgi:hypothetical protein
MLDMEKRKKEKQVNLRNKCQMHSYVSLIILKHQT